MKIQRQITSILSTILIAGMSLGLPLQAQQSNPQPQVQQPQVQQPQQQNQSSPSNTQPAPANDPSATPAAGDQANPAQQPGNQQPANQQPANPGTNVNPSQGPLQPVKPVTTYPDASGGQQAQPPSTTAPAQNIPEGPQPKKQPSEPVGAATAESVPTSGGAAAKPAGVAIAPAKQHQTRSLLVKIGAVVAAGAAVGTVYALTRSTSSTPPGANLPGVVQK
jgi:hypothetical protein